MGHSRFTAWESTEWRPYPRLPLEIRHEAVCRAAPLDWFFPQKGKAPEGKKLCKVCPAQVPCLEYALANHVQFGLWGGLTERERYKERQRRRFPKE